MARFEIEQPNVGDIFNDETNECSDAVKVLYDVFWTRTFGKDIHSIKPFKGMVDTIFNAFKQEYNSTSTFEDFSKIKNKADPNKVVVAFSAGLDSVYNTLKYIEKGMKPYLIYIDGINSYDAKLGREVTEKFAEKMGLDYKILKYTRHDSNEWIEHPLRNVLIKSLCVDYAKDVGAGTILTGEEASDSIFNPRTIETGMNVGDSTEIQEAIQNAVLEMYENPINFVTTTDTTKEEKLQTVINHNCLDYYRSCTTPVRFFELRKRESFEKYGQKMPIYYWCGSCAKCSEHAVVMERLGKVTLTEAYKKAILKRFREMKYASYDYSKMTDEEILANLDE